MNNKIENLLSGIERIKHIISKYDTVSRIPDIERDILLDALRDMYSALLNVQESKPEVHIQTDIPSSKPVEFMEDAVPVKPKKTEKPMTADIHPRKEEIHPRKAEDKKKGKLETIGDKLQGERQFVYETLAEKTALQNISSKLQSKPITNINSAIGINDKFKLMKDLFNEDTETYVKTINKLDACNNFNEAFTYISTNFNWDMEDDSVQFILDLVRRKFIVDKDE